MKNGYELPSDRAGLPGWLKMILVWGVPIALAHVVLLWGLGVFGGDKKHADSPADSLPAAQQQAAAGNSAAQPVDNAASPTANKQPAGTKKTEAPSVWSFDGAAQGDLNLPGAKACRTGILVDADNHRVLWMKEPRKAVPVASMVKMMTLLLAVEDLDKRPEINFETPVPVSKEAYDIGGSQVWLDPRETFPLGELLKTIAIKSANDSAYLVAEFLSNGDVAGFVARMNARARELGMTNTTFLNSHGLEDGITKKDSLSSAFDMVILGEQLLAYPKLMAWASTPMDSFRDGKTELKNHNNLVFQKVPGVDGLKTGFIIRSGFCVTVSCLRGGKRVLLCVTGFKTSKERDTFSKALLDWGYTKLAETK